MCSPVSHFSHSGRRGRDLGICYLGAIDDAAGSGGRASHALGSGCCSQFGAERVTCWSERAHICPISLVVYTAAASRVRRAVARRAILCIDYCDMSVVRVSCGANTPRAPNNLSYLSFCSLFKSARILRAHVWCARRGAAGGGAGRRAARRRVGHPTAAHASQTRRRRQQSLQRSLRSLWGRSGRTARATHHSPDRARGPPVGHATHACCCHHGQISSASVCHPPAAHLPPPAGPTATTERRRSASNCRARPCRSSSRLR